MLRSESPPAEEEITAQYPVQSGDGRFLTVVEYTTITIEKSLSAPVKRLKGAFRFELLDGRSVNRIDDESFEIRETGGILLKL